MRIRCIGHMFTITVKPCVENYRHAIVAVSLMTHSEIVNSTGAPKPIITRPGAVIEGDIYSRLDLPMQIPYTTGYSCWLFVAVFNSDEHRDASSSGKRCLTACRYRRHARSPERGKWGWQLYFWKAKCSTGAVQAASEHIAPLIATRKKTASLLETLEKVSCC